MPPAEDVVRAELRAETAALKAALARCAGKLAVALLGRPTGRSRNELRYRRRGSLAVVVAGPKAGSWYDHEADESGDALALIMRVRRLAFVEAKMFAVEFIGGTIPDEIATAESDPVLDRDDAARTTEALSLWDAARDPRGTVVERYLTARKVPLTEHAANEALRFHPGLWLEGRHVPGMVGLMRDVITNEPRAIHRTLLDPNGNKLARRMLGHAKGCAIKLTDDADVTLSLTIGEGVETCLSADLLGFGPTWAVGSAGAIATFPVLPGIETLRILIETDDSGANARAADACAGRWHDDGREVLLITPQFPGDMNDVAIRLA